MWVMVANCHGNGFEESARPRERKAENRCHDIFTESRFTHTHNAASK